MSESVLIGGGRPLRICDVCGVIDDHPRHVHASLTPGLTPVKAEHIRHAMEYPGLTDAERDALIADIVDTSIQQRHLQCCKAAGCPDGTCNLLPPDLHGADLLEHIASGAHTAAVEAAAQKGSE